MTRRILTTRSPAATSRLGRRLGALLADGDVVALVGDLGAGKTHLTRGACQGAGVAPGDVSSPTFAIVQTYRGRLPVHHADLYRIGDLDELYATGLLDLVGGAGALLVEWADRIDGWLPPDRLVLRMSEVGGRPSWRRIELEPAGARHEALAEALAAGARAGSRSRSRAGSRSGSRSRSGPRDAARPERSRAAAQSKGSGKSSKRSRPKSRPRSK